MALGITARHPRLVRFCGLRSVIGVSAVIVALVSVLTLTSAQATGGRRDQEPCTWGHPRLAPRWWTGNPSSRQSRPPAAFLKRTPGHRGAQERPARERLAQEGVQRDVDA